MAKTPKRVTDAGGRRWGVEADQGSTATMIEQPEEK
jgi:hypothetical protein